MAKFSIISLLVSVLFYFTCLCFESNSVFLIISLCFSILSLILLFKKFRCINVLSYCFMCILLLFKTDMNEVVIISLIGGLLNNLIFIIFDLEDLKIKLSIFDIISIFILLIGFYIPISYYYVVLTFLLFSSSFPIIYSLYKSVINKELEKNNIKVNRFDKFEKLCNIKNIIFSKTGVLTLGQFEINKIVANNENLFWKYLTYAEATRNDRIGKIVMENTPIKKYDLTKRLNYHDFYNGIKYYFGKKEILVGNSIFLYEHDVEVKEEVLAGTVVFVSVDKKIIGYMVLTDKMRLSTKDIINNFRSMGIKHFSIFSNDQERLNTVVSRTLSIHNNYGNLTKQSKEFWLYYLKQQHGKNVILISDDHTDFDVTVKINLNSNTFNGSKNSDIIVLDKDLKKTNYVYEMSILLNRWKKNLLFLLVIGKLLLVLISLLFISDIWIIVLCNYVWILLEITLGCSELLK